MSLETDRRIIVNHQASLNQVRERVRTYAERLWSGLGSYRDEDIERFVTTLVPTILNAQKQTWQITNSYLDALARTAGVRPWPASAAMTGKDLRGIAPEEVYRRPAVTVYTALSGGKEIAEAVAMGLTRLDLIVATDMQLASSRAYHSRLSKDNNVAGYRRVIRGVFTCALCQLASTQRYHKKDLMAIHPGCDCTVAPIFGSQDPGQVINDERLRTIREAAEKGGFTDTHAGGKDRTWTDLKIEQHGEYGPTLTWKDQRFTGPADF